MGQVALQAPCCACICDDSLDESKSLPIEAVTNGEICSTLSTKTKAIHPMPAITIPVSPFWTTDPCMPPSPGRLNHPEGMPPSPGRLNNHGGGTCWQVPASPLGADMLQGQLSPGREGVPSPTTASTVRTKPALFKKGSLTFDRQSRDPMDFYDFLPEPVGQGTYGQVVLGVNKETFVKRAIKVVDKSKLKNYVSNPSEFVRRELDVLRRLDHPNIVKIFETFEDFRYLYIVLEYCEGGDLLSRILEMQQFNERSAALFVKEILSAVYYMHENSFIHRDLKPDNFLFAYKADNRSSKEPPLKLIDFGLAKRILRGSLAAPTPQIGTPAYMAPEVHHGHYDEKADVWSCGVMLHVMLSGRFPNLASAPSIEEYFAQPAWSQVSVQVRQLMRWMLQTNPLNRCTAVQAMQHQWVESLASSARLVSLHATVVEHLSDFVKEASLKKMALNVVAREMTENDIEDLKKLFQAFDINGDCMLTFEEMKKGVSKCSTSGNVDLLKLFEEIDTDGSGSIDYTEFLASSLDRKRYTQESVLWQAFKTFDVDGSGAISTGELQQVLNQESISKVTRKSKRELEALVAEVDVDGDGEINFEEFLTMMRS